jgi:tRNA modification GTPase
LSDTRITEQLRELIVANDDLLRAARQGQRLRDGLHAVIIGPPNAGKSSLLNALAGAERAIVTDIAGTTRDLLREQIVVDGVELTLVDTAGLRHTDDRVEAEGVRRARAEIDKADLVLIVVEHGDQTNRARLLAESASVPQRIVIHNKIDRVDSASIAAIATGTESTEGVLDLPASVLTGAGLDRLRAELSQRVGGEGASEATWSARARHVEALNRVGDCLRQGAHALEHARAGELLAEELRQAQQALGEITGTFRSDDLLGAIFASFCIGK